MNKQELLNLINTNIDESEEIQGCFYRGKTFIVVSSLGRIKKAFKTKRGAEGYINKNQYFSYYDDYCQELIYPNRDMEVIEVLENEYIPVDQNKNLWYLWIKNNINASYMWDNIEHTAERLLQDNQELLSYVKESLQDLKAGNGLTVYEVEEKKQVIDVVEPEQKQEVDPVVPVDPVAEVEEVIKEVATTQEEEPKQEQQQEKNINVEVKFNAEKNGIELYFTEKPSKELLENLKGNGFRWARFNKCWYTKDSEEKREYLKSLNLLSEGEEKTTVTLEEVKEIEYPTIDINDIENYHISQRIIDQENNNSMFRREDTDHNEVIKRHLQSYNNEVLKALQGNTDPKHEYYSLRWLQSYKKRYFDLYVKMLTHRANNPSWMVTGRGGLNVARYNKKQDQYSKMVGNMAGLQDEYKEKIRSIKYKIKKQVKQLQQEELNKILETVDIKNISLEKKSIMYNPSSVNYIFEGGTVEKKVNYLNGYYTLKNWGCWRVYDEQGKEVFATKTTGKLEDAKKWIIARTAEQLAS